MASTMSSSFFESDIESDLNCGLYNPDFSLVRKPTNHTTFKVKYRYFEDDPATIIRVFRPADDEFVPTTDADELLTEHQIRVVTEFTLSKQNTFNDMIKSLDEFASIITSAYDKETMRDVTTYTLPVTSFIKTANKDSFGYRPPYLCPAYKSICSKNATNFSGQREQNIIIDGERYSNYRTYKRSGNRFIPMNIRENTLKPFPEGEQIFRFSKKSINRDSITLTFHRDVNVNSILLHPENLHYEFVHSTAIRCGHRCSKMKHCIRVLKNDPQFLSKIEVHYRSDLTNGQWVKHGTFNGSTSMFDDVRIDFDEIQVKEIRIVPLTYHKGFDKITIDIVGTAIHTIPVSNELFVIYKIYTPRDGKYVRRFDNIARGTSSFYPGCNCSRCTGKGKENTKQKHRDYADNCSDLYE